MITTREQKNTIGISREQLNAIPLERPERAGRYWRGIGHGELVEQIAVELDARNIKITSENWYLFGGNACLAGTMGLELSDIQAPNGTHFSLGIHHGNDMSAALRFAVGASVFVCSNGIVTGDFIVKRRHTLNFNLAEVVHEGIDRYIDGLPGINNFIETLQGKDISNPQCDRLLMEAGRQKLLPWSRIGAVDAEFHNPTFSDFGRRDAWGLYNAFTYVVQKCRPQDQVPAMIKFRGLLIPAETVANN